MSPDKTTIIAKKQEKSITFLYILFKKYHVPQNLISTSGILETQLKITLLKYI